MQSNNRHTVQIKQLLKKKKLSKSRFDLESNLQNSKIMRRQLKISDSSSSLIRKRQQKYYEIQLIEKRYQDLYSSFLELEEQTRKKMRIYQKQEDEIAMYEKAQQRDNKEIQRLKLMIGYVRRLEYGVQTQHIHQKDQKAPLKINAKNLNKNLNESIISLKSSMKARRIKQKQHLSSVDFHLKQRQQQMHIDSTLKIYNQYLQPERAEVKLMRKKAYIPNLCYKNQQITKMNKNIKQRMN